MDLTPGDSWGPGSRRNRLQEEGGRRPAPCCRLGLMGPGCFPPGGLAPSVGSREVCVLWHLIWEVGWAEKPLKLEELEIKTADESFCDKMGLFTTPSGRGTSLACHRHQEK